MMIQQYQMKRKNDEDDDTTISDEKKKSSRTSNADVNDGDATPEEDSPHPPPSAASAPLSSIHRHPTMTRLPDQIAQYPTVSDSSYTSGSQSTVESNASIFRLFLYFKLAINSRK